LPLPVLLIDFVVLLIDVDAAFSIPVLPVTSLRGVNAAVDMSIFFMTLLLLLMLMRRLRCRADDDADAYARLMRHDVTHDVVLPHFSLFAMLIFDDARFSLHAAPPCAMPCLFDTLFAYADAATMSIRYHVHALDLLFHVDVFTIIVLMSRFFYMSPAAWRFDVSRF